MTISSEDLSAATTSVTKKWTKQRKAEERGNRSRSSRQNMHSGVMSFTAAATCALPLAYKHASGEGQYPVSKRQLYYACREDIAVLSDRQIEYETFCTILLQYMNRNPATIAWRITADPRGTLTIPNCGHEERIPCGTLPMAQHLLEAQKTTGPLDIDAGLRTEWPSVQAGVRYQGVLYIEKEGFEPILREANIAERYDLAIMSCKGQSVVAARHFVDETCAVDGGVPLFVLHDFDKAGFEIAKRLTSVSKWARANDRVAYEFKNEVNVTDIGLRLADVEQYNLFSRAETVTCSHSSRCKCFQCQPLDEDEYDVTDEEFDYLNGNRRVELNALSSPQLIGLIETKLKAHGLGERLIPEDDVLHDAFRRAMVVTQMNQAIDEVKISAIELANTVEIPADLRSQLRAQMDQSDGDEPWDQALCDLVKDVNDKGLSKNHSS